MDYEMDEDLNHDEREGCRSLLCDSNGIIIAEMVYRCMACSRIHEFMGEARRHYHENHMEEEDEDFVATAATNNNNNNSSNSNNNNNNTISYGSATVGGGGLGGNGHHGGDEKQSTLFEAARNNYEPYGEMWNSYSSASYRGSICKTNAVSNRKLVDSNWKKNSSSKPKGLSSSTPTESCTRSGYITCPVCTSTRFYTTLQRRYGQFTCVACYRFFKEFFTKPRKYYCPNLGLCSLDVKAKCKACWISACVSVYSIDGRRKAILDANTPSNHPLLDAPSNIPLAIEQSESSKLGDGQEDVPIVGKVKEEKEANRESASLGDEEEEEVDEVEEEDNCKESNEESVEDNAPSPAASTLAGNTTATTTTPSAASRRINAATTTTTSSSSGTIPNGNPDSPKPDLLRKRAKARVKNWCCLQCKNCLADDCGKCINCLDRPKFGGKFIRKQRCINKKCLLKMPK